MRYLLMLAVLSVVVAAILITAHYARQPLPSRPLPPQLPIPPGPWAHGYTSIGGTTTVWVRRVRPTPTGEEIVGEQVIATIQDDDPDYDMNFLEAEGAAITRASLLNSAE